MYHYGQHLEKLHFIPGDTLNDLTYFCIILSILANHLLNESGLLNRKLKIVKYLVLFYSV